MHIAKKNIAIVVLGILLLGVVISSLWHRVHNPMKPLYVEVVNGTNALIPSVVIEQSYALIWCMSSFHQATFWSLISTSIPSVNTTPVITFAK